MSVCGLSVFFIYFIFDFFCWYLLKIYLVLLLAAADCPCLQLSQPLAAATATAASISAIKGKRVPLFLLFLLLLSIIIMSCCVQIIFPSQKKIGKEKKHKKNQTKPNHATALQKKKKKHWLLHLHIVGPSQLLSAHHAITKGGFSQIPFYLLSMPFPIATTAIDCLPHATAWKISKETKTKHFYRCLF